MVKELTETECSELQITLNTEGWQVLKSIFMNEHNERIADLLDPNVTEMIKDTNREIGEAYAYKNCCTLPEWLLQKSQKRSK